MEIKTFYMFCKKEKEHYWLKTKGIPIEIEERTIFLKREEEHYDWDDEKDKPKRIVVVNMTDGRTGRLYWICPKDVLKDELNNLAEYIKTHQDYIKYIEEKYELSPLYNSNCKYPIKKAGDIE